MRFAGGYDYAAYSRIIGVAAVNVDYRTDQNSLSVDRGGIFIGGPNLVPGEASFARITALGSASFVSLRRVNGTVAAPTPIVSGDIIGELGGNGTDTAASVTFLQGASIRVNAEEDWNAAAHGSNIEFRTAIIGGTSVSARWQIEGVAAAFRPFTDNTRDIGMAAARVKNAYLATALLLGASADAGGGVAVAALANATTAPTANPVGGSVAYAQAGATKVRGSAGTITTIAPA